MNRNKMSVVVVSGGNPEKTRCLLKAFMAQTEKDHLEIIFVYCSGGTILSELPETPFPVRSILMPPGTLLGHARYEGFKHCSTSVVAFLEDHAIPAPLWAKSILEAHRKPAAAVGYSFRNGSSGTYVNRAVFLAEYGQWSYPQCFGFRRRLPGINVAYKKEILDAIGLLLKDLLISDFNLHQYLLARGHTFYIARNALVYHECYKHMTENLLCHFLFCRLQAGVRVKTFSWSLLRRLFIL